MYLGCNISKE